MSKDEIRRRISKDEQSVLASRCRVLNGGKECGCIFVVNRRKMDNHKSRTDPRIVHLNDFHHIPTEVLGEKLANPYYETIELPGEYNRQKVVFFDELYLTEEQVDNLIKQLWDWLQGGRPNE